MIPWCESFIKLDELKKPVLSVHETKDDQRWRYIGGIRE